MKKTRNGVDLTKLIRCPSCRAEHFIFSDRTLSCSSCNRIFNLVENQIPILCDKEYSQHILKNLNGKKSWEDYDLEEKTTKIAKFSNKRKSIYQRLTPSYRVQIGPTYHEFIEKYNINGHILEIGGGPNSINHQGVINCDINNYPTVDIISDARKLPFKNQIFEAIICNSVLEHIFDVEIVVAECARVLKNGGFIFMCVPQVCGRHHTIDYFRWTIPGLKKVFDKFNVIDEGVILGPGMFISHLFTSLFRELTPSKIINKTLCFLLEWLLFPLRFLDLVGKNNKNYEDYAHTIFIIGQK